MYCSNIVEGYHYGGIGSKVYLGYKWVIDFTSGIFCTNIGHSNREITETIQQWAKRLHTYTYKSKVREQYIKKLCDFTGFESAALFSSGTEAAEAAWRIMRQYTNKPRIMGMGTDAFHGKTLGAQIMAHEIPDWRNQFHAKDTCGIIMEPYTAHLAKFHPPNVINKINSMIEDFDLLLCVDEIQSGFGRTGKMFGFEHYINCTGKPDPMEIIYQPALRPDLVCIGKGMGNGFPLSGVLGASKLIDDEAYQLSSTHGGNPLACAVGIAVIDYMIENDVISESARKGRILHEKLSDFEIETHGKGLVAALVFNSVGTADALVKAAASNGLLVVHTGRETVKLGPPLTIPDEQLEEGIEILKQSTEEVLNE